MLRLFNGDASQRYLLTEYLNFFRVCITLPMPFSLKMFKVIATLARYFILGFINSCISNINIYKIFDKMKSRRHSSNLAEKNRVNKFSISVTFDLWFNSKGRNLFSFLVEKRSLFFESHEDKDSTIYPV